MKWLDINVSPSDGIQGYWIAVGRENVIMANHKGSISVENNRNHVLTWWMTGNPGASLSIAGKNRQGAEVVEVKKTVIPAGEIEGAGTRRFTMI